MSIIKSKITDLGPDYFFEDYPILILFNDTAPPGLREVCVIHETEMQIPLDFLKKGSKIKFGDVEYAVEDIGEVAGTTLNELGHISLYFGLEEGTELMAGAALLSPYKVPDLNVGDEIQFIQ